MAWRGVYEFRSADEAEFLWEVPALWWPYVLQQAWLLAYPTKDAYEDFAVAMIGEGLADEETLPLTWANSLEYYIDEHVWCWHPLQMVVVRPKDIPLEPPMPNFLSYGDPVYRQVKASHGGIGLYINRYSGGLFHSTTWANEILIPRAGPSRWSNWSYHGGPWQQSDWSYHGGPVRPNECNWELSYALLRIVLVDEFLSRVLDGVLDVPERYKHFAHKLLEGETRVSNLPISTLRSDIVDFVQYLHEDTKER